ncbi:MAG: acyl-CoA dehydrogenase C-terminal domain-containing protein, partial [Desulfobacterales bacterium]
ATAEMAKSAEAVANKLGEVAMHMGATAMSDKVLNAFAHAHPFLEVCGDVAMAWQLLWRATTAAGKLEKAKKKDIAFYEGQLKSAEYFINSVLPVTLGKMNAILNNNGAAVEIAEEAFGAK